MSTLEEIRERLKTNDEARYTNLYDARDLLALLAAQSLELQAVREALRLAECALADIGDSEGPPEPTVKWCELRASQALPVVRAALKQVNP